jgi:hypothetical protein
VYNVIRLHSASDRELALHLISRADLLVGVRTLTRWFLPFVPDVIGRTVPAAALMVSTVCVLYQVMRRAAEDPESDALAERGFPRSAAILWTTNASLVVWTVTYGVFLLLSISFADRATPLDARILSPAQRARSCIDNPSQTPSSPAAPAIAQFARLGAVCYWCTLQVRSLV